MRCLRSLLAAFPAIAMLCSCGGGDADKSAPASPVLASIRVIPADGTVDLGFDQTFTAIGTLTDNTTQDVTQTATWSSSDYTVLFLNNAAGRVGVANTRGPGVATVTAAVGSIKGTTQLTVVRPTPKFLYAGNTAVTYNSGGITAYSVNSATGALTAIGTPYTTGAQPVSLALSRDSKFLYVAEPDTNLVAGYLSVRAIQADGSLVHVTGSPFPIANAPAGMVAHPTADFLYLSTAAGITVEAYDRISGTPTTVSSGGGRGSNYGAITPDGSRFYETFFDYDQFAWGVAGFSVDRTSGVLSELPGDPIYLNIPRCFNPEIPNPSPSATALDPAGKFLYVSIGGGDAFYCPSRSIYAYSIDATSGVITQIPGSPFTAGITPFSVAAEASGRFLFVANGSSNSVSAYSIDPDTGVLTEVAGSPFPTPAAPFFVVADPSAMYLYVGTAPGIVGFTIDQTTGELRTNPGATVAPDSDPRNYVTYIAVTH